MPMLAAIAVWAAVMQPAPSSLLVSTSELAGLLKDSSVIVLHVADRPALFEEGHIPGARFVRSGDISVEGAAQVGSELPPFDQLERVFEAAGVSDSSRVVIYGTNTVAAARAFLTLDVMGHSQVAVLNGGLRAWRAENRPIESGAAGSHPAGRLTLRPRPDRIVNAEFVQVNTRPASMRVALVDVRPDPEFLGTDGGMAGRHAAGHIPGARQLPWDTLVGPDGRFLARDQLQSKLQAAGATADRPVVSYCMVGLRASVVYFIARLLGYDARLYDGSIVDWSQRQLPVETGRN
jgi:thiosulfate/3-mercaptopyruvate sulfurtransferase